MQQDEATAMEALEKEAGEQPEEQSRRNYDRHLKIFQRMQTS